MYEDYLEEFVFKTGAVITEKLFGKKRNSTNTPAGSTVPETAATTPAAAIIQSRDTQANQAKDESKNDKKTESNAATVTKEDAAEDPEKEETTEKSEQMPQINKKKLQKKRKKVEFSIGDSKSGTDKSDEEEASTSAEPLLPKSKSDLEVNEGTVVASGSQESFEVLYNQLDPGDVELFSRRDEPEEMTEEERKEMEKAEAGLYRIDTIDWFFW